MHVGILSRNPQIHSTTRLTEAAVARGHRVTVVDYLRCTLGVGSIRPAVRLDGEELAFDAVIPRIGATHTGYGAAVVRQFEAMGVPPLNRGDSIARSRDKLHALQLLAGAGLGLPITAYAHATQGVRDVLALVGGPPVVVKVLEGTQGIGVARADTAAAASAVIRAFRRLDADVLVQEFVAEAGGADLRALVVGGRVVAAMRRTAAPGEFRANLHRGGRAEPVELEAREQAAAVAAAGVLDLAVSGVDMLRSQRGPLVVEVNSSPGLGGIERASGVDVADAIVAHLERVVGEGGRVSGGSGSA